MKTAPRQVGTLLAVLLLLVITPMRLHGLVLCHQPDGSVGVEVSTPDGCSGCPGEADSSAFEGEIEDCCSYLSGDVDTISSAKVDLPIVEDVAAPPMFTISEAHEPLRDRHSSLPPVEQPPPPHLIRSTILLL